MRSRTQRALFGVAITLTGCTAVLGVNDVFYDPNAPQGGTSSGSSGGPDGATTTPDGATTTPDGATTTPDGAPCTADTQSDAENCGRCGHDCGGGSCTQGKCEAVTVADVARPAGLATDGTFLYVTSYSGGQVLKLEKLPQKPVVPIGSSVPSAMGIAVGGNNVYVTNEEGASTTGGIHRCVLPACTAFTRITPLDYAHYVAVTGTNVFASTQDSVVRTNLDGTSPVKIAGYTQCFGIAADDTHVYVGSFNPELQRIQYDGGSPTPMGPRNASTSDGFVTVDGDRVFWAYEDNGSKKGQVLSSLKAAPATRTTYTGEGKRSLGIAADADWVYWADGGTVVNNTLVGDGTLNACPRVGCPGSGPTVLATGLKGSGQVVLDAKYVYWAELGTSGADGRVRKVAKP